MAAVYNISRGTRARLNTLVSQSAIVVGREYLLTDENKVLVGTSTNTVIQLQRSVDDQMDLSNLSPGLPGAGVARLFRADVGGREMLRVVGDDGDFATMQPHMGRNNPSFWMPAFGTTTATSVGMPPMTVLATATARTWAASSRFTRARRLGFVSAATAGTPTGFYTGAAMCSTGDTTSGAGGFHLIVRFGIGDALTSARMFIGLSDSVATPANAEINTLTQHIGIGKLSTSSNLCVYASGTAAQAVTDLGTSYPAANSNTDLYEFILFAPSSTVPVTWMLSRFLSNGTSTSVSGTFAAAGSTAPAATIGLAPRAWRMPTTANSATLDVAGLYLETDF
jgi:hypothetical protein